MESEKICSVMELSPGIEVVIRRVVGSALNEKKIRKRN
jgi:hypothetical protein